MRRWILAGLAVIIIPVMLFITVMFFVSGAFRASACSPSIAAVKAGTVTLGSGPASDAYFSLFGEALVVEKQYNAAIIIQVGKAEGISDYGIAIAIATSLQASGLRNLTSGELDSVGLFKQRPSAIVWGTLQEIMDPIHAAQAFIVYMKENVPNYDSMAMVDVAIAIQNPANVSAYQSSWQWDQIATEIVTGASVEGCGEAHLPLDPGYFVTDGFNEWRDGDPHKGIDLDFEGDASGHPVYAALSGVVIDSGIGNGCSGNNPVIILTDIGLQVGYYHMYGGDILVGVGDQVTAGQQIGVIGNCGQSNAAHLHFEVNLANATEPWLSGIATMNKYGATWLDPEAVLAYYGVVLFP